VARGVATTIDCSPESDQNVRGSSHTVSCVVTDAFGTPVQGASVDFAVTGRNPQTTDNQFTNSNGVATLTYTDSNAALTQEGQADTIEGCIEPDGVAGCASVDTDSGNSEDVVSKFWFTTLPTAGTVQLDMDPGTPCQTGNARQKTATNTVDTTHTVCATVTNANGTPLQGQEVTFTTSGPGGFYTDTDQDGNVEQGEFTPTSFTTQTNAQGQAFATIASQTSGTTTVTSTSGGASDNGTKVWTATTARSISCDPETATNPPGTSHVIECVVVDRFGNPTNVASDGGSTPGGGDTALEVVFTESGPGRITSDTSPAIPASGTVEVVVATTETESGTQQITAEIEDDTVDRPAGDTDSATADLDDACDQPAGRNDAGNGADAEATAGDCEVTVEKVWEEQVEPQCSDGIDNDGDGLADDQDGGCYDENGNYDADDNDETNVTETTVHARTVEITKFKHIDLPGKKKPALMVKGQVTVDDGFTECNNFAPVKIQLRASGEWITRKTDFTNENGVFKVLIRHVQGKYRAVATRFELFDQFGNVDVCQRAEDTAKHKH
jgi:hypothetical protein